MDQGWNSKLDYIYFLSKQVKDPKECLLVLIPDVHSAEDSSIYEPAEDLARAIMEAGNLLGVGVEEPTSTFAGALLPKVGEDPLQRKKVIDNEEPLFKPEPKVQAGVAYQLCTTCRSRSQRPVSTDSQQNRKSPVPYPEKTLKSTQGWPRS